MKIDNVAIIVKFAKKLARARKPVDRWLKEMEAATLLTWIDVRQRWADASFLSSNRVVFNINGNDYRLLVQISFASQSVKVLDIGTHQEYDKWKL